MKQLSVNVVSESVFTVRGHGVHTAFEEHVNALKSYTDYSVKINAKRPTDIVHVHTVGPYGWRKFRQATHGRVINAHVTPGSFIGSLKGAKLWAPFARWYLKFVYNKADHIICVSPNTESELRELGIHKPMSVIPNMVELAHFKRPPEHELTALRRHFSVPDDKPVIVCSGQVQPRKGVADWRLVAEDLTDYHFLWIGGIPFGKFADKTADMEQMMASAPDNVTFTGVVELETARKLYHLADVFWLPSYQETFGLVVVEAAACRLPVVLRDIPVYRDIFEGTYQHANTNKDFAQILKDLITKPTLYKKQQKLSDELALRYASKTLVHRYESLYKSLVGDYS
jgi:1,2-diacylglycerol-3-alpha-glucose alpha-1,2-galactosyltransferase